MCCCSNPCYDIKKSAIIFLILLDFFTEKYTAVIWPKYYRYSVKTIVSFIQSKKDILVIKFVTF